MNITETNTSPTESSTNSSENLRTPRQILLFRDLGVEAPKVASTSIHQTSRSEWAKDFIKLHELHTKQLQDCVEFYKLTKSEQDSVRYQLRKILVRHQRDNSLSNLTRLGATTHILDSKRTAIRTRLSATSIKGWGMSLLLYSALLIALGLLGLESISYYTTSRGMSFPRALAFSVLVELMLLIFFLSREKKIRFLGWMVFLYSTATCGLWVLHQDSVRVQQFQIAENQRNDLLEKKSVLKNKIKVVQDELDIAISAQKKLLSLGFVTKSFAVREEIVRKKIEIADLMKEVDGLDASKTPTQAVIKAGAIELDSYSQFGLRILLQLFVMNFSVLKLRKRRLSGI